MGAGSHSKSVLLTVEPSLQPQTRVCVWCGVVWCVHVGACACVLLVCMSVHHVCACPQARRGVTDVVSPHVGTGR